MHESDPKRGKNVYIQGHLLPQIEAYGQANNLPFAKAVNEILGAHFRKNEAADNAPATRKDVKRILKRIELTNLILEPALLELIEASVIHQVRAQKDAPLAKSGRQLRKKYVDLFKDLRAML